MYKVILRIDKRKWRDGYIPKEYEYLHVQTERGTITFKYKLTGKNGIRIYDSTGVDNHV